ncbi:thiamine-phosphate kinase [Aliidiomarina iranensis]|uniref:Thiamine-monophosphate kinase n=1 Tax=Aliidiomarina iranensis TaxID=1434071 RepID=A0A432VV89_9GAMM|nr:thiamine-phosphate kinase [Aliidiomarina iranensis]RUO20443.1 thiamine-phosphate kinase [Aliidiomarina iranensis]
MNIRTDEFSLIAKYFQRSHGAGDDAGSAVSASSQNRSRRDIAVGIGDDAAIVIPPTGCGIAVTTDTMVSGVHFDEKVPVDAIGHKLVAVNLSDLAAMGAEPAWLSLSCAFPSIDENWLTAFSRGFFAALDYYHCELIGGDITKGPLTLTLTAQGIVPAERYLKREGAQPGDRIYVSGTLGDAALALAAQQGKVSVPPEHMAALEKRLFYPTPRVALGQLLRNQATSAIDLSDGLLGDIQHILVASGVGARIQLDTLPFSQAFAESISGPDGWRYQIAGGDDYELCFTIPESRCGNLETLALQAGVKVTCVGIIDGSRELRFFEKNQACDIDFHAYSHFQGA